MLDLADQSITLLDYQRDYRSTFVPLARGLMTRGNQNDEQADTQSEWVLGRSFDNPSV